MSAVDIIMKKRGEANKQNTKTHKTQKEKHNKNEGYVKGEIPDYQISAYLMAVYFNGMSVEEVSYLTQVMLYSGEVIDLSRIKRNIC